jgi:hypothetical protein
MHWLFFDGIIPLLGANLLFLAWGVARRINYNGEKGKFKFQWKQAVDPSGWLYGASLLAMQLGRASLAQNALMASLFFVAVAICFLLLLANMTYRGDLTSYEAPPSLNYMAIGMVVLVLGVGYASKSSYGGPKGTESGASAPAAGPGEPRDAGGPCP